MFQKWKQGVMLQLYKEVHYGNKMPRDGKKIQKQKKKLNAIYTYIG